MFYTFNGAIIETNDISAIVEPDGYYQTGVTIILKNGQKVEIRNKYSEVKDIIKGINHEKI